MSLKSPNFLCLVIIDLSLSFGDQQRERECGLKITDRHGLPHIITLDMKVVQIYQSRPILSRNITAFYSLCCMQFSTNLLHLITGSFMTKRAATTTQMSFQLSTSRLKIKISSFEKNWRTNCSEFLVDRILLI